LIRTGQDAGKCPAINIDLDLLAASVDKLLCVLKVAMTVDSLPSNLPGSSGRAVSSSHDTNVPLENHRRLCVETETIMDGSATSRAAGFRIWMPSLPPRDEAIGSWKFVMSI